ncbi:MAG: C10 family peptidase [Bacteroidales bacterium]|nr:C10 family peptidase [Bacteroidales bacterium]
MKKKNTILMLMCLAAAVAEAKPVSPADALRAATHFWQSALGAKGTLQQARWAYSEAYLFVGNGGGFVVLSADDCARPVLAYSTTSPIAPEALPEQLAARLEASCGLIAEGVLQDVEPSKEDAARWQALLGGSPLKDGSDEESIGPLLETRWHQDGSYSLLCPQGTVTGCAATAQSQFMRYWCFPAFGEGQESYSLTAYGNQSADFAHTLYDWPNMLPEVNYTSSHTAQVAVSTLMYHVGVSLHMSYNSPSNGGSGAAGLVSMPHYPSINNSLMDYFHYSRQMRPIYRTEGGWTDQAWNDSLANELRLRHPIVYCGVAPEGGHGFVCDGFEYRGGDIWFHFNFGWSGNGDGYYTTEDICPNVSPTGQVGSVYHFNQSNQALLGAVPEDGIYVSDTLVTYVRSGGEGRVLFADSYYSDAPWSASCDQPWLHVDTAGAGRAGWVTLTADENTSGSERRATVTFIQEGRTVTLTAVQTFYSEEDYCPVHVVMKSTGNAGWQGGAYLSFESASGFVFGTTTLSSGYEATETVQVAPDELKVVFHSGGSTDRYIDYFVYNQYDEELVSVEYAYRNGGTHTVSWPCAHVGIDRPEDGAEETPLRVELYDLGGRLLSACQGGRPTVETLPAGVYVLRTLTSRGVSTEKIVKQ